MAIYDWHLGIDGNAVQDSLGISALPNGLVQGDSLSTPMTLELNDIINFVVFDLTSPPLGEVNPGFECVAKMAEVKVPFEDPFQQLVTSHSPGSMFSPYFDGTFPVWTVATYAAVQAGKFLLTFTVPVVIGGELRHFRDDPEMVVGEDR